MCYLHILDNMVYQDDEEDEKTTYVVSIKIRFIKLLVGQPK